MVIERFLLVHERVFVLFILWDPKVLEYQIYLRGNLRLQVEFGLNGRITPVLQVEEQADHPPK